MTLQSILLLRECESDGGRVGVDMSIVMGVGVNIFDGSHILYWAKCHLS